MAEKLGSYFLKEFSNREKPILLRLTKRELVLITGVVLGLGLLIGAYVLEVPEWLSWFLALPILGPSVVYGTNLEERYVDRLRFRLINQKRPYQTEQRTERRPLHGSTPLKHRKAYQETDTF